LRAKFDRTDSSRGRRNRRQIFLQEVLKKAKVLWFRKCSSVEAFLTDAYTNETIGSMRKEKRERKFCV